MRAAVATGINEADPLSMLELRDDWPDPIAPDGHILVRVGAPDLYGKVVVEIEEP